MIPEYLSQKAATEDLDCLITVNIAQQKAEEIMQFKNQMMIPPQIPAGLKGFKEDPEIYPEISAS